MQLIFLFKLSYFSQVYPVKFHKIDSIEICRSSVMSRISGSYKMAPKDQYRVLRRLSSGGRLLNRRPIFEFELILMFSL